MALPAFDLSNRVVLITGGNGGIGLGMAEGLAAAGADLVIWGTNRAKLDGAFSSLRRHGRRLLAQQCDVAAEDEVEDCMAEALAEMGRLDGCIANAGISQELAPLADLPTAEWRRVMNVNVDGAFFTLRAAARHMVERAKAGQPGGRLVLMASTAAVHGAARAAAYGASKGAMVSLTRALAVEMARWQVTANAILPGWTESEMTQAAFDNEKFAAAVLPRIPARRWGTGDDFAGLAVYLMSDASRYHTGDSFVVDGAYTIF